MFSTDSIPDLNADGTECTVINKEQLANLDRITTPLETLRIAFILGDLDDEDADQIAMYLKNTPNHIKNLWVVSSGLNNEQAECIIDALVELNATKPIEGLSLSENDLKGDVYFLSELKKLSKLRWLNLGENDLANGIDQIIEIICNCQTLEELHLSIIGINDRDLEKLCIYLVAHPSLTKISLDHNRKITDNSVACLKRLIAEHKTLQHINLFGTNISMTNIHELQAVTGEVEVFFGRDFPTLKPRP